MWNACTIQIVIAFLCHVYFSNHNPRHIKVNWCFHCRQKYKENAFYHGMLTHNALLISTAKFFIVPTPKRKCLWQIRISYSILISSLGLCNCLIIIYKTLKIHLNSDMRIVIKLNKYVVIYSTRYM